MADTTWRPECLPLLVGEGLRTEGVLLIFVLKGLERRISGGPIGGRFEQGDVLFMPPDCTMCVIDVV